MRRVNAEIELDFSSESVEVLLLMTVLGPKSHRHAARMELKKREALVSDSGDRDELFVTNLSGIC